MDNKQTPDWEELTFSEEEPAPVIQDLDFQPEEETAPVPNEPEAVPVYEEIPILDEPVMEELSMEAPLPEETSTEESSTEEFIPESAAEEESIPEEPGETPVILYPQEDTPFISTPPESGCEQEEASGEEMPGLFPSIVNAPEAPAAAEPDLEKDILSDPTLVPAPVPEPGPEEPVEEAYQDTAPAPAQTSKKKKAQDTRPTLKGRPKRKKGEGFFGIPNILATGVWLALILAIGVTMGRMLWVCAADVLAFGREDKRVTITVYEADTMEDVIDKLYDAGLIRYRSLFNLYAAISDAEEDIKPGIYDLNTRYDYHALVNSMSPSSSREVIELTIPEGYTCRQIFALLEENRVCTAVDIAAYAADGQLSDYWFLEGLERGSEYCLEGYLFPDTYQFYKNSSPREALEKMLDNFEYRFSEEMRAQIEVLNANVTGGSYGIREIVIVASLIEKESAAPAESPTIASVIYNRLFFWDYPALLNIDAAIVYAQGGDAEHIDTSIDSPYNTYRYTGLTPTAISNPGLASLKAALNPEKTDYYYYVLNPGTGMHQFSKTQAEHDAWIDEFYN